MNVGEIGVQIIMTPSGLTSLTGYTVQLMLQDPVGNDTGSYIMTVASNGQTATYTTVGNEFDFPGTYTVQFWILQGSTILYKSIIQYLTVGPSI